MLKTLRPAAAAVLALIWLAGCQAAELSRALADSAGDAATDSVEGDAPIDAPSLDASDTGSGDEPARDASAGVDTRIVAADTGPADSARDSDGADNGADTEIGPRDSGTDDTAATDTSAADSADTTVDTGPEDTAVASDPDAVPDEGSGPPAECNASGVRDCSPGSPEEDCADLAPMFGSQVNASIDAVIAAHPEWFEDGPHACCPSVLQNDPYVQAVAAEVTSRGLCAIQDPNAGDEIGVKLNNACAESYDILTSDGYVRRPPGAHTATCWPGWF